MQESREGRRKRATIFRMVISFSVIATIHGNYVLVKKTAYNKMN